MDNGALRAAVVGSGFGGLAAAIRLQSAGVQTTLFEKRDQPGGRAYVYREGGFVFDAGPTVITAPECLEELFALSGKRMSDRVELLPVRPFYRLAWEDGDSFDYDGDLESTLRQIETRSKQDVDGYRRFLAYSERVFNAGYSDLVHVPFLKFSTMIRAAPDLLRLKAYRSVFSMVSRYISNPRLREAFSFHSLLVGGNPFETSSIYTLIHFLERKWGVWFPRGGTGALVQALVDHFVELGGEICLGTPVKRLLVDGDRVTGLETGQGVRSFDVVVSNADVMHTYRDLLSGTARGSQEVRRLERKRWSMSLFLIYFGTRRQYPGIKHHTILFGPRYRGLLQDIFKNGRLAEDFSLYLHAPTRSDPSLAPPGCEGFYVLSPVPHLGHSPAIDWDVEAPLYADAILSRLESTLLPGLRESIVVKKVFTPLDFKSELNAHLGSAFSLEPVLTQSAYFRTHNRDDKIRGLYFVGAGAHPGAGVPGVVNSAKATSGVLFDDVRSGLFGSPAARSLRMDVSYA